MTEPLPPDLQQAIDEVRKIEYESARIRWSGSWAEWQKTTDRLHSAGRRLAAVKAMYRNPPPPEPFTGQWFDKDAPAPVTIEEHIVRYAHLVALVDDRDYGIDDEAEAEAQAFKGVLLAQIRDIAWAAWNAGYAYGELDPSIRPTGSHFENWWDHTQGTGTVTRETSP